MVGLAPDRGIDGKIVATKRIYFARVFNPLRSLHREGGKKEGEDRLNANPGNESREGETRGWSSEYVFSSSWDKKHKVGEERRIDPWAGWFASLAELERGGR